MKYLFILAALLFIFNSNANSQTVWCGGPNNLTPPKKLTITFPALTGINCQNKDVDVYYCCSYEPVSGLTTIDIKMYGIWDLDCWVGQDFSDPALMAEFQRKTIEQLVIDNSLACNLSIVPSCENPPYFSFIDVVSSSCFKIVKEEGGLLNIVACETTGTCVYNYSTCIDYSKNPAEVKVFDNNYTFLGTHDQSCEDLELVLDPQYVEIIDGSITVEPYTSDCHTVCE